MPKQLFIVRHAESAEKQVGQLDKERELTSTGMVQAAHLGTFIFKNQYTIDRVYASSARRAVRTAELVCDSMKVSVEQIETTDELLDATPRTFFAFIREIDPDLECVMCIGHNPVVTYVAEYLTKSEIGNMSPGSLAIIEFKADKWSDLSEGSGELIRYVSQEILLD